MGAILDIVTSVVLGGILLMTVVDANDLTAETTSIYSGEVLVQEMIITQAQLIEREFRNMGAGSPGGTTNITAANDSSITFRESQDPSGATIDNITYYTGPVSELDNTPNELDRRLYRRVNAGTPLAVGVVTVFRLLYLSSTGDTLRPPFSIIQLGNISEIELSMEVQNPYALSRLSSQVKAGERNALYATSYWQQMRLASKNFNR